jgi:hypothetical protein
MDGAATVKVTASSQLNRKVIPVGDLHTPVSAAPQTAPADSTVIWEPVNTAVPRWHCPHCNTNYGTDYDTAHRCAALGPAPDVVDDVLVLTFQANKLVFGPTEAGKAAPVMSDDGIPVAHTRRVVVDGHVVSSADVDGAAAGEFVTIPAAERHAYRYGRQSDQGTLQASNPLLALLGYRANSYRPVPARSLVADGFELVPAVSDPDRGMWLGPLGDHWDRFNMLTAGFLTAARNVNVDTELERLPDAVQRRHCVAGSYNLSDSKLLSGWMLETDVYAMIAAAHGAVNDIWRTRWLTVFLTDAVRWRLEQLVRWANGDDVTVPLSGSLRSSDTLPRNPGKKRLELMDGFGDDYRQVWSAVTTELVCDPPTNPVPGCPDAYTFITGRHQVTGTPVKKGRSS